MVSQEREVLEMIENHKVIEPAAVTEIIETIDGWRKECDSACRNKTGTGTTQPEQIFGLHMEINGIIITRTMDAQPWKYPVLMESLW